MSGIYCGIYIYIYIYIYTLQSSLIQAFIITWLGKPKLQFECIQKALVYAACVAGCLLIFILPPHAGQQHM